MTKWNVVVAFVFFIVGFAAAFTGQVSGRSVTGLFRIADESLAQDKAANSYPATTIPYVPVRHPSSDNLQGARGHMVPWTDENVIWSGDVMTLVSDDPSALLVIPLKGRRTVGDVVTLEFRFGGRSVSVKSRPNAQTLEEVAVDLAAQIKAETALFVPPTGGMPGLILGVSINGCGINVCLDYRSDLAPLVVVASVSGAATEIVTPPPPCSTSGCPTAWDNNPVFNFSRAVPGVVPPSGSELLSIYSISTNSNATRCCNTQYGNIANQVINSKAGEVAGRWVIGVPDPAGSINRGLFVGPGGIYAPGVPDPGVDGMAAATLRAGATQIALSSGEIGLSARHRTDSAPGPTGGKLTIACGTKPGTAALVVYAGTSLRPTKIVDNVGEGVGGC